MVFNNIYKLVFLIICDYYYCVLNEARQFKINFLCSAIHDTVAVTNSLSYTVQTSDPIVNLMC